MATRSASWPITIHSVDDLGPDTPCAAVAFAGSTLLFGERLPHNRPFAPLLAAAQRWTGAPVGALCAMEGAGLNGLAPLLLSSDTLPLVDADFMGRALPRVDQMSLLVDRVPGVIVVCSTGDDGFVIVDTSRAADTEALVRGALVQAGGVAPVLVTGFTVADLRQHAILGCYERALRLGETFTDDTDLPVSVLAERLGGRMLGTGRVTDVVMPPKDTLSSAIEVGGDDGALLRLVARSELLVLLRDGALVAASPEIIVAIDSISRDILQVDGITLSRHVSLMAFPAPGWWLESDARLAHVIPSALGLSGWEEIA